MTYRERRRARAERLRGWAKGRERKAEQTGTQAEMEMEGIPLGQPILVGHHSEKRHRRTIDRIDNNLRKSREHGQMADKHRSKAANIDAAADAAIYSDDHDAIEALEARIADLEAQRERMKYINKTVRAGGKWSERIDPPLSDKEMRDLEMAAQFNNTLGYPSYALSNLSGNLSKQRKRLAQLKATS